MSLSRIDNFSALRGLDFTLSNFYQERAASEEAKSLGYPILIYCSQNRPTNIVSVKCGPVARGPGFRNALSLGTAKTTTGYSDRLVSALVLPIPKEPQVFHMGFRFRVVADFAPDTRAGSYDNAFFVGVCRSYVSNMIFDIKLISISSAGEFIFGRTSDTTQTAKLPFKYQKDVDYFIDLKFDRAAGKIYVWLDNFFCGEQVWDMTATFPNIAIGTSNGSMRIVSPEIQISDLFISTVDGAGWQDRFGPDMWVSEGTATADVKDEWTRPISSPNNFSVVQKSPYQMLTDATTSEYLTGSAVGITDAYKYEFPGIKSRVLAVATNGAAINAASAIHSVAPVIDSAGVVTEITAPSNISPGAGVSFFSTLSELNPATGAPFTPEELVAGAFGLKVTS